MTREEVISLEYMTFGIYLFRKVNVTLPIHHSALSYYYYHIRRLWISRMSVFFVSLFMVKNAKESEVPKSLYYLTFIFKFHSLCKRLDSQIEQQFVFSERFNRANSYFEVCFECYKSTKEMFRIQKLNPHRTRESESKRNASSYFNVSYQKTEAQYLSNLCSFSVLCIPFWCTNLKYGRINLWNLKKKPFITSK